MKWSRDMEDDDLKMELNKLKKFNIRMKNYLDIFNEEFDTKVKLRDEQIPLLIEMAGDFLDKKYRLTDVYKYLESKKIEIENQFIDSLSNQQIELFKTWEYITGEMMLDMQEQGFLYGFVLFKELDNEIKELKI